MNIKNEKYEREKFIFNLKVEDFYKSSSQKTFQELTEVWDLYMSIQWFNSYLYKYPNPVPEGKFVAITLNYGDPTTEITGINQNNIHTRNENGVRWATPMVFVSTLSIIDLYLTGIKEVLSISKGRGSNSFIDTLEVLKSDQVINFSQNYEFKLYLENVIQTCDNLRILQKKRNSFIHRRDDKTGKEKPYNFHLNDTKDVWVNAVHTLHILDLFINNGILNLSEQYI